MASFDFKSSDYTGIYKRSFGSGSISFNIMQQLKRDFLFFDKIIIPSIYRSYFNHKLHLLDKNDELYPTLKKISKDFEYLLSEGHLVEPASITATLQDQIPSHEWSDINAQLQNNIIRGLTDAPCPLFAPDLSEFMNGSYSNHSVQDNWSNSLGYNLDNVNKNARNEMSIIQYMIVNNTNLFPIPILDSLNEKSILKTEPIDTCEIIIPNFPIPQENIDFKQIINHRDSHRESLIHLRRYLRELVLKFDKIHKGYRELEEQLIIFKNNYEKELKNYSYEIKKLYLQIPINLITLRFDKIVTNILEINKKKFNSASIHTKLEGKEVAYISISKERFTS